MGYKVKVQGLDEHGKYILTWHTLSINPDGLIAKLRSIHARNVPNSDYIEFDNEEDAVAFKLKYG